MNNKFKTGFILVSSVLSSCAVGPNFRAIAPPATEQYTQTTMPEQTVASPTQGGDAQFFVYGQSLPTQWWELFQSEKVNQLIQLGLECNPSLNAAQAALTQAKANLWAQIGSTMLPSVNGQLNAQRQRFSNVGIGETSLPSLIFNVFNTQVNVSYMLDVFGGNRRAIEALAAQVDYQQFLLEGTYLSLTSNIATTAITQAQYQAQVAATKELIQVQSHLLNIIKQQFQLGAASISDVLSQESQLAQTQATLPPLEKSQSQAHHALIALVGKLPSEQCVSEVLLSELTLPTVLPVSLPATMVRQRPDIRAQEALVHAASANIGVATANMLPQFNITADYGWTSAMLSNLFSSSNKVWDMGIGILQPLFQGGALFAKRKAAIAAYQESMAQYQQTVIQAFQNVADALKAIEWDAKALQAQEGALLSAQELLEVTQEQFNLGAVDYLTLLNAQKQYQQALLNRVQAQANRYVDTVALFQALGGGWWNDRCVHETS